MADDTQTVLSQLDQAQQLAFSSKDVFSPVVKQILNLVNNPNIEVQRWCADFLKRAFLAGDEHVAPGVKIDLAIDALVPTVTLAQVKDIQVYKCVVDLSVVLFRLVFRYVAENDGCNGIWANLNELKTLMVSRYESQFPFDSCFDSERDAFRNIECKLETLKFLFLVIDFQLRSGSSRYFSLARVDPAHTLIKQGPLEAEANAILSKVLKPLYDDILVTPIVTATLNHLAVLVRRKRQFADKIMAALDQFDSSRKLQSNYESLETFKLSRKYADRALRVLLSFSVKSQLVPPKFVNAINRKLSALTAKGDDIRKKNILLPGPEDLAVRKRKFEGFENASKKIKALDYKNLYALTDVNSDLNNFDLSTLPQNILVSMALTALNKANVGKLSKALEIVCARYTNAMSGGIVQGNGEIKKETNEIKNQDENENEDEDDEEDDDNFDPNAAYSLPPPTKLSFEQKKEQVSLIVQNFFDLAKVDSEQTTAPNGETNGQSELAKVAIKTWAPDSWLILLTRLATRGMHTIDGNSDILKDVANNEQLSDVVRQALFDYFLADIHDRVDVIIEWLNEEWYNEKIANEEKLRETIAEEVHSEYLEKPNEMGDLETEIEDRLEKANVETPRYNHWAQKVLDQMIPFLEPTDRKVFLRMLSDLPHLNKSMLDGIKSLCGDPARAKLGFLSLQFLLMYRPPAKDACMAVLNELKESDQEDLREEAQKLLEKYSP